MMSQVEEQAELPLRTPVKWVDVAVELIRSKGSSGAAITLACDSAITLKGKSLEDKEIYFPLGIDKGYFSNIKSGKATLQADKIQDFCQIVGNNVYPEWLAYQVGCTLVQIETETQRQLRIVQDELQRERAERLVVEETMRRILTGATT